MADILFLRGAPAFSVFRLQGLQQRIQKVAPGARIAGGTDEIQKNTIAERVLGLPGEIRTDRDVPFNRLEN